MGTSELGKVGVVRIQTSDRSILQLNLLIARDTVGPTIQSSPTIQGAPGIFVAAR